MGVTEASQDRERVSKEIKEIKVTHGNTSALAVLRMVADHLHEHDPPLQCREIFFLTDLQRATWNVALPTEGQPANGAKGGHPLLEELNKSAQINFVNVGRDGLPNVAITDLAVSEPIITTGVLVAFQATVPIIGGSPEQPARGTENRSGPVGGGGR